MQSTALRISLLAIALFFTSAPLEAQSDESTRVRLSHPGVEVLKTDLQRILNLTEQVEQRQWQNIADFIDTFVYGVDYERPLHVEVLLGVDPISYMLMFPLDDGFQTFRDNIEGLGYELRRDSANKSLYEFKMQFDNGGAAQGEDGDLEELGWFRVLDKSDYVAGLLTYRRTTLDSLKDYVLGLSVPGESPESGMSAELQNSKETRDDIAARRESVQAFRDARIEAVRQRPDETKNAWQLRRLITRHLMDELERMLAESASVKLQLDLQGEDDLELALSGDLAAIDGTGLQKAVAEFNTRENLFGGVASPDNSALSILVNHPIDEMRIAAGLEFVDLVTAQLQERLSEGDRSSSEKTAITTVAEKAADHLRTGISGGWLNLFVESAQGADGEFTTLIGYNSPSTAVLTELLPELAKIGDDFSVRMGLDAVGNTAIHSLQLGTGVSETLERLLGKGREIFVGIGEDRVWLASGAGALDQLKEAIAAAKSAPIDSCLSVEIQMQPWTQRLVEFYSQSEAPEDLEQVNAWRARERRRARALRAYEAGGDTIVFDASVKDGHVLSSLLLKTGIVRFLGKEISAFSKENLSP